MNPKLVSSPAVVLAAELIDLIERYGKDEVRFALEYVSSFPISKSKFTDGTYTWELNENDKRKVIEAYAGGMGKIQAIKLFRDITMCGLKEAKDAIENYFR